MISRLEAVVGAIVVEVGLDGTTATSPARRIGFVHESHTAPMLDVMELRDEHNQYAGIRYPDEVRLATDAERAVWEEKARRG